MPRQLLRVKTKSGQGNKAIKHYQYGRQLEFLPYTEKPAPTNTSLDIEPNNLIEKNDDDDELDVVNWDDSPTRTSSNEDSRSTEVQVVELTNVRTPSGKSLLHPVSDETNNRRTLLTNCLQQSVKN